MTSRKKKTFIIMSDSEQSSSDSEVEVEIEEHSSDNVNSLALNVSKINLNVSKDDILDLSSDDEEPEGQNQSAELVLESDISNNDVSLSESETSSRSEGDVNSKNSSDASKENLKPPQAKDDSLALTDDEDLLALSDDDEISVPDVKSNSKIEIVQNLKRESIIVLSDDESSNSNQHYISNEKSYPEVDLVEVLSPVSVPQVGQVKAKTKPKARLNLEKMAELLEKEKYDTKKPLKKILNYNQLEKETRKAERAEKDRLKRIEARRALFENYFAEEGNSSGILDFNLDTKKVLVKINKAFISLLKPHQLEGIKFMYDCVIESVDHFQDDDLGSGCILAHSMGLGKTLQIVVFLQTILTNRYIQDKMERVLIIVPYNVIENWAQEFEKWFEKCDISWSVNIFEIRNAKTLPKRLEMLKNWYKRGGILLITSTLFSRIVSNPKADRQAVSIVKKTLLSPGPDLVVIDEGHLLKNDESSFNLSLSLIETQRRIVLTGTPLQNNLTEYFVMVDFVKPQLLGTKKEFKNRFQNPIERGQHTDSDQFDVMVMKKRIHVLFQMLKGCIHRQDYQVLVPYLQPKFEYVLSVRMTQQQIDMYKHYLKWHVDATQRLQKNFFRDKQLLSLVWSHPALMHDYYLDSQLNKKENFASTIGDWYLKFIDLENIYNIELGVKFSLLFVILEMCEKTGDKIVVFSQSLFCLNLMERLLRAKMKTFNNEHGLSRMSYDDILDKTGGVSHRWVRDKDYFRIDGGVESEERSSIIDQFNDAQNQRARLMLVSTRAGGIGTNLIGANRAIIFDASMNPSHDVQAIFRIYRLGQSKPVYVYRFTTFGTMEDKIYKRQIVKQSLSGRVVDEQQILRHYSSTDLREMYKLDTDYGEEEKVHPISEDAMLNEILLHHSQLIVNYHEHDSLLENRPEEELSEEERKTAWAEYERVRNVENVVKLGPTANLPNQAKTAPTELDPSLINQIETISLH